MAKHYKCLSLFSNVVKGDIRLKNKDIKKQIDNFATMAVTLLIENTPATTGNAVSAWDMAYVSAPKGNYGFIGKDKTAYEAIIGLVHAGISSPDFANMRNYKLNEFNNYNFNGRKLTDTIYINNNASVYSNVYTEEMWQRDLGMERRQSIDAITQSIDTLSNIKG